MSFENPRSKYSIVINHEEQYSFWPSERDLPKGWKEVRSVGTMTDAIDHIVEVWTDMRPLSLRFQLREGADRG